MSAALAVLVLASSFSPARASGQPFRVDREHPIDNVSRAEWNGAILRRLLDKDPQGRDKFLLDILQDPDKYREEPGWGAKLGQPRKITILPPGDDRNELAREYARLPADPIALASFTEKTTSLVDKFWPKAMAGRPTTTPPEAPPEEVPAVDRDRRDPSIRGEPASAEPKRGGRRGGELDDETSGPASAPSGGTSGGNGGSPAGSGGGETANPAYDRQLAGLSPNKVMEEANRFDVRTDDLGARLPSSPASPAAAVPSLPSSPLEQGFRAPGVPASGGPMPTSGPRLSQSGPKLSGKSVTTLGSALSSPFSDASLRDSAASFGAPPTSGRRQSSAGQEHPLEKKADAEPNGKGDELSAADRQELEAIQRMLQDAAANVAFDEPTLQSALGDGGGTKFQEALASDLRDLFSEFGEEGTPFSAAGVAAVVEQRFDLALSGEDALRLGKAIRAHGPPPPSPQTENPNWWRRLLRRLASCWRGLRRFVARHISPY